MRDLILSLVNSSAMFYVQADSLFLDFYKFIKMNSESNFASLCQFHCIRISTSLNLRDVGF